MPAPTSATSVARQPSCANKPCFFRRNIQETPAGNEVIKRLLAKGFIAEQASPTNRRSKLLTVTPAGQGVLFASFGPMSQLAHLASGNLSAIERRQLLYLLQKLDAYHYPNYAESRPASFGELVARHLPGGGPGPAGPPATAGPPVTAPGPEAR